MKKPVSKNTITPLEIFGTARQIREARSSAPIIDQTNRLPNPSTFFLPPPMTQAAPLKHFDQNTVPSESSESSESILSFLKNLNPRQA